MYQNIQNIILVGGGGHCKSCIAVIESTGAYKIAGILDLKDKIGEPLLDYMITGSDEDIVEYIGKGILFHITAGQIKTAALREQLYHRIRKAGGALATLVAASAILSRHSTLDEGCIVMNNAIVNSGVVVGANCIINNVALVDHDAVVGHHTHISTMAVVNGDCKVGSRCFIGSNAVVNQGITIADDVVIGSGSVVREDIQDAGVYAGNPLIKIS